jgi:hypothetical protein
MDVAEERQTQIPNLVLQPDLVEEFPLDQANAVWAVQKDRTRPTVPCLGIRPSIALPPQGEI